MNITADRTLPKCSSDDVVLKPKMPRSQQLVPGFISLVPGFVSSVPGTVYWMSEIVSGQWKHQQHNEWPPRQECSNDDN